LAAGVSVATLGQELLGGEVGWELPTFRYQVLRDVDLLAVTFTFVNFRRVAVPGPRRPEPEECLVSFGDGRSTVVVEFPPQNIAEAIFVEQFGSDDFEVPIIPEDPNKHLGNVPVAPVTTYVSGPSRVAFAVPGVLYFPLGKTGYRTADTWLRALAACAMRLPRNAQVPATPALPKPEETCLELPFRLFLAPSGPARWLSSADTRYAIVRTLQPGQLAGVSQEQQKQSPRETLRVIAASVPLDPPRSTATELWHATLLAREPLKPASLPPGLDLPAELRPPEAVTLRARAVFSPDYRTDGQPGFDLFYPARRPLSLHALTRHRLVKQMAEGNGWVDAEHLVLSALGASASLSYASQKSVDDILKAQLATGAGTGETELAVWKHRVVVGRDVYFAEAFFGFLFPFVYPAVYVEITQRKFAAHGSGKPDDGYSAPGAYLLKRAYIIAQQTDRQYTNSDSTVGRNMPVKRAVLELVKSPPLLLPQFKPIASDCTPLPAGGDWEDVKAGKRLIFVPRALQDEAPVNWPVTMTDESGRQSRSPESRFLFADNVVLGQQIWEQYLKDEFKAWRIPAQPIAYTPERPEIIVSYDKIGNAAVPDIGPGARPVSFQFEEVERRAIAVVGKGVRQWLKDTSLTVDRALAGLAKLEYATHQNLEKILATVEGDLREKLRAAIAAEWGVDKETALAKLNSLRNAAIQVIGQATATISRVVADANDKQAAFEELVRRLEGAEQVSSTLETHLLKFGTKKVADLFDAAKGLLELQPGDADLKTYLKRIQDSKVSDFVKAKVAKELGALQTEASAWKARIAKYVNDIRNAEAAAKQFGTDVFHAAVDQVAVAIPALKALDPKSPARTIELLNDYLAKGMAGVANGVYASIQDEVNKVQAVADQIKTGLAKPNAVIQGLSRELGALVSNGRSKVEELARNVKNLDLSSAIPDAKLFGVLPLRDVLGTLLRGQVPTVNLIQLPDHWEHVWDWNTPLKSTSVWIIRFDAGDTKDKRRASRIRLVLRTRIDLPKAQQLATGSMPRGEVELRGFLGRWDETKKEEIEKSDDPAFALELQSLIRVNFDYLRLEARYRTGDPFNPSLKPQIKTVEFLGPLKFIAELEKKLGNLGGGFNLDLTPQFVGARFSAQIPPVSFGLFSLRNLSMGAGLRLSLTDEPLRFDFNFSSWENRSS
jgi:hypothetical protein